MRTVRYLTSIPRKAPEPGHVVVQNHVRPTRRLGSRGFRAWIAAPDDDERIASYGSVGDPYEIVRCDCDWASELGEHYRVAGLGRLRNAARRDPLCRRLVRIADNVAPEG